MPPRSRLDGIVIRQQPVRDADLIVALVTADHGRVDVLARGGRKSTKRFSGGISLFAEISAIIEHGRGHLPTLVESTRHAAYLTAAPNYPQLALASYVVELAAHASQPDHADSALHGWLRASLALCETVDERDLRTPRLALEVGFLQAVGVFPDVQSCCRCGRSTAHGGTWQDADAGLACAACLPLGAEALPAALVRALALWSLAPAEPPVAPLPAVPGLQLAQRRVASLLAQVVPPSLPAAAAVRELQRLER